MTDPLDDGYARRLNVPVVDLSRAPGEQQAWNRPRAVIYLWAIVELIFVTNPWQISSAIRIAALRSFGAKIGSNVIFRPRTRVKFPWNLTVGDNAWIGEGAWIHNQDSVVIGANAVLSQEVLVTTGTHAHRRDMALLTRPVRVSEGAWITSRCVVLGGTVIGRSALITPGTVVKGAVPDNVIWGQPEPGLVGTRFDIA